MRQDVEQAMQDPEISRLILPFQLCLIAHQEADRHGLSLTEWFARLVGGDLIPSARNYSEWPPQAFAAPDATEYF